MRNQEERYWQSGRDVLASPKNPIRCDAHFFPNVLFTPSFVLLATFFSFSIVNIRLPSLCECSRSLIVVVIIIVCLSMYELRLGLFHASSSVHKTFIYESVCIGVSVCKTFCIFFRYSRNTQQNNIIFFSHSSQFKF